MRLGLSGTPTTGAAALPSATDTSCLYVSRAGHAAMMEWYARCLARLPFACTSLRLPTRYGETHALACGPEDAPPVVLLHGTEGTALSWRLQMAALCERFRVYSLDILGANGRSAPVRLPWTGRGYGEWLADVLDALGLESASFAGISNGAWHVAQLALVAPRRIARAALLSANGFVPVRRPYCYARFAAVEWVRERLLGRLATPERVRSLLRRAVPECAAPDEDEVESLALLARYYHFRYPPGPLSDDELRALGAPALLLMGRRDPFYRPEAVIERARRVLPDLREAEVLPAAGHGLLTDQPEAVNARLAVFLGG